ncbi:hypothetical protein HanIR_Chr09g0402121 [Helianthus annuus]|nr:hypothetical protein HanIR_Chr09g0402121 [Helianthus annuus]
MVSTTPATTPLFFPYGERPSSMTGFGSASNTLTEPVWDTVKHLVKIVSNLTLVVFPNPFREDPGKALRD